MRTMIDRTQDHKEVSLKMGMFSQLLDLVALSPDGYVYKQIQEMFYRMNNPGDEYCLRMKSRYASKFLKPLLETYTTQRRYRFVRNDKPCPEFPFNVKA